MIQLFRRIRQKLLSENKLSTYLVYAIGEIILVMIGILLALQVNNWNEKRNQDELRITYYQQLLDELTLDNNQIELNLERQEKSIASYQDYLKSYERDNLSPQEIFNNINKVNFSFGTIEFNTYTIEVLKSTGDIRFMPKALRNKLVTLKNAQTDHLKNKGIRESMSLRIMEDAYLAGPLSLKNVLENQSQMAKALDFDYRLPYQIAIMHSGLTSKTFAENNNIWELKNILALTDETVQLIRAELNL
ncbi:MAG: DUF6090 family protein [Croceivirga sp.]